MKPKTQIDFLVEEFFNTGKLNLNGKDDGITLDQLDSLKEGPQQDWRKELSKLTTTKSITQVVEEYIDQIVKAEGKRGDKKYEEAITSYKELKNMLTTIQSGVYFEDAQLPQFISGVEQALGNYPQTPNTYVTEDGIKFLLQRLTNKKISAEEEERAKAVDAKKIDDITPTVSGEDPISVTIKLNPDQQKEKDVAKSNMEDLPTLQQGQEINNPTNLTTLQFILLNNYVKNVEDKEKLNNEITHQVFSSTTQQYVIQLQRENKLPPTGKVDEDTWDVLMKKLTQEQNFYFETVAKEKGIELDTIKKLIEYGKDELNDKEELFVNSMSKFLMILLGQDPYPGIYDKYTYKRGIDYDVEQEFGEDLEKIISDYTKVPYGDGDSEFRFTIEDLEELKRKKLQYNQSGYVGKEELSKNQEIDKETLKKEIKDLEEKIETKNKKAEGFRENYPFLFRSDQDVDDESKKRDKKKYFDSRKEQDQRTIHGLFEKIYNEFKKAIKDKSYSLDEISNIVFMINNTIYKLFTDTSMTDQTTLSKTKRAIKGILEMVVNAKDREEMFEFVLNITDPYKVKAYAYELSFCECGDGEYFKCDKLGDQSTIISDSVTIMKSLMRSNKSVAECVDELYKLIGEKKGENIDKYDIIAQKEIVLEGGHIIRPETKIEVKRTDPNNTDYHFLSEFFGVYKSSYNIEHYSDKYAYDRYNEIVSGLVKKLNEKGGIGEAIIKKVQKDMGGLFLKNYYYYPKGHFKLVWGDTSRGTLTDEKRVALRYELIGEGYRWVEGNCNIPDHQDMTNESMDKYISEVLGF
jgi:hypothetical protein